jgi:alginate O-acetyltransferase complex protein AlgI
MLFNSLTYAIFFPIVFVLYWFYLDKNLKVQNFFLLAVSYIFYGWWDWRFLGLIFITTLIDYLCAMWMAGPTEQRRRKLLLAISIVSNLGLLFFFKYFNFFIESFVDLSNAFGFQANPSSLKIILPVGISFYTFQSISYTIDVYYKKMEPSKDPISFFAFVSFFPQLVAGPIERAKDLLPQFSVKRVFTFEKGVDGMRLIVWGLFKKVVVADNCAVYVDTIFLKYENAAPSQLVLALVLFSFQIYGDFSGYSDIAKGSAKLLGFDLITNFKTPYFSRDIAEFWRRWHISLTSWFKDYIYIPLGGSMQGKAKAIRNTFIIFLVSGFWHGANWTFVLWGLLHGLYFLPILIIGKHRTHLEFSETRFGFPTIREVVQIMITFGLVTFAWLFFRSNSVADVFHYLSVIWNPKMDSKVAIETVGVELLLFLCVLQVIFEWLFRREEIPFTNFNKNKFIRYTAYLIVIFAIIWYGAYIDPQSFIYFQF